MPQARWGRSRTGWAGSSFCWRKLILELQLLMHYESTYPQTILDKPYVLVLRGMGKAAQVSLRFKFTPTSCPNETLLS